MRLVKRELLEGMLRFGPLVEALKTTLPAALLVQVDVAGENLLFGPCCCITYLMLFFVSKGPLLGVLSLVRVLIELL